MEQKINSEIAIEQAGFRKGRGTRNQITNMRYIEKAKKAANRSSFVLLIFISH